MKVKSFLSALLLFIVFFAFSVFGTANAQINNAADCIVLATEAEQVSCLQVIIAQITAQIQEILAGQNTDQDWCHTFNVNLGFASSGNSEVGQLHTALSKQGFSYAPDTGNTYSDGTAAAVSKFQEKYAPDVLAPWGLTQGTGYVGSTTRAKLNQLYGCGTTPTCTPNWQCTSWSTCLNGIQTKNCTDYNYCGTTLGKPATTQTCGTTCTPNWQCTAWGNCSNGIQTKTCTDYNYCGTADGKPATTQGCTSTCSPDWDCVPWSACVNGIQTRTCSDINTCGINSGKPAVAQLCSGDCTPYWNCTPWSSCLNNTKTRTCSDINFCGVTTGKPAETESCSTTCTPNWQCSDWSACINGTQTKTCTDINYCGTTINKPPTTQSCIVPCSDTDNGLVYTTKGTATGKNNWDGQTSSYSDYCTGDLLTEYQCSAGLVAKTNYTCQYGCDNGACFPIAPLSVFVPSSGDRWTIGQEYQIGWQPNHLAGQYFGAYDIYLLSSDNTKYTITLNYGAGLMDESYYYNWTTGVVRELCESIGFFGNCVNPEYVQPGTYKVKVCRAGTSLCNSSNNFTLPSPPLSLEISSPKGGNYLYGDSLTIEWNSSEVRHVYLDFVKGPDYNLTLVQTIVNNLETQDGQNSYSWQIPSDLATEGSDYRIRILAVGTLSTQQLFFNSDFFAIWAPSQDLSLQVLAPTEGQTHLRGQRLDARWNSVGVKHVNLQLMKGGSVVQPIVSNLETKNGENTYGWKIPSDIEVGSDYKIKITGWDGIYQQEISVLSDSFSILDPLMSLKVNFPNGGESLDKSKNKLIAWTSSEIATVTLDLYKNGLFVKRIISDMSSKYRYNNYTWWPDLSLIAGSDYKIKITGKGSLPQQTISDQSNSNFSIF